MTIRSVRYRIEGWDPKTRRYRHFWTGSAERAPIQFDKSYYPPTRRLLRITTEVVERRGRR